MGTYRFQWDFTTYTGNVNDGATLIATLNTSTEQQRRNGDLCSLRSPPSLRRSAHGVANANTPTLTATADVGAVTIGGNANVQDIVAGDSARPRSPPLGIDPDFQQVLSLIEGAASVPQSITGAVSTNMLASGLNGGPSTPAPNGGIPVDIHTVHDAGVVFNDAMTKLIDGVYSGNQQSILNDLSATGTGLEAAVKYQGITGPALDDINHVISLLEQESALVGGIHTDCPYYGLRGQWPDPGYPGADFGDRRT